MYVYIYMYTYIYIEICLCISIYIYWCSIIGYMVGSVGFFFIFGVCVFVPS